MKKPGTFIRKMPETEHIVLLKCFLCPQSYFSHNKRVCAYYVLLSLSSILLHLDNRINPMKSELHLMYISPYLSIQRPWSVTVTQQSPKLHVSFYTLPLLDFTAFFWKMLSQYSFILWIGRINPALNQSRYTTILIF